MQSPLTELREAKRYALMRLSRKMQSERELSEALQKRGFSLETISLIITECRQFGYLDDKAWLEGKIRAQISKGYGPRAIIAKLQQKGVNPREIEDTLKSLDSKENRQKRLKTWAMKKKAKLKPPYSTLKAALYRRGYSYDEINALFASN